MGLVDAGEDVRLDPVRLPERERCGRRGGSASARPPRHSRTARSPSARAHSAKAGSFRSVRAWSGVLDRSRRGQAALGSAASKSLNIGYGKVRWTFTYTPRR